MILFSLRVKRIAFLITLILFSTFNVITFFSTVITTSTENHIFLMKRKISKFSDKDQSHRSILPFSTVWIFVLLF